MVEWNPTVELGLTVCGHRKKRNGNDIESVIPVGKKQKEENNEADKEFDEMSKDLDMYTK